LYPSEFRLDAHGTMTGSKNRTPYVYGTSATGFS
jgi:hypothetical protein